MISLIERDVIKEFYGVGFVFTITKALNKAGYKNRNGDPFLTYSVSDVLNGKSSQKLEYYIIAVWEEEIKRRRKIINQRVQMSKSLL